MPASRPILGFGVVGWIATTVLIGLITLALSGDDFQSHFYWALSDTLGGEATMWFIGRCHAMHWYLFGMPMFGLIAAGTVIIAWYVNPKNGGWWRCWLLVLLGVIQPILFTDERSLMRSILANSPWWSSEAFVSAFAWTLANLVTTCALWLATGSSRVMLVTFSASFVAAVILFDQARIAPPTGYWNPQPRPLEHVIGPMWQASVAASLLWWAISARLRDYGPTRCPACGYDVHATAHAHCPECGHQLGLTTGASPTHT